VAIATRPDDVERQVAAHLAERDARFTRSRRQVVRFLHAAEGPLSASGLHAGLDGAVPLSSLYRTLSVLEEAGVLAREHDADGTARYELAEWLTGHHHHLVCLRCGAIEDVEIDTESEAEMSALVARIAADRGFAASGHRIDIEGRCPRCHSQ
jgi:Fur family ferric uptake transcriptional regulator